jgi:hypothetical protein
MTPSLRFIKLSTTMLLALSCAAPACATTQTVQGNGVIEEQNRGTGHFNSVVLDMPNEVAVDLGATEMITVITDENLQDLVETKVTNGILHIALSNTDMCIKASTLKIRLNARMLGALEVSGGGSLNVNNKVHISGDRRARRNCN